MASMLPASASSSSSTSVASVASSPQAPLLDLLHKVFALPNAHRWVADFLFADPAPHVADVSPSLQASSSALMHVQTATALNRFALVPVFSRDALTVGFHVPSRARATPSARCAFDNQDASLLSVERVERGEQTRVVCIMRGRGGSRSICVLALQTRALARMVSRRKFPPQQVLACVLSCQMLVERGTGRCATCKRRGAECVCMARLRVPKHPMDLACFRPNVSVHEGRFEVRREVWKRDGSGGLVRSGGKAEACVIEVTEDAATVRNMCARMAPSSSRRSDSRGKR